MYCIWHDECQCSWFVRASQGSSIFEIAFQKWNDGWRVRWCSGSCDFSFLTKWPHSLYYWFLFLKLWLYLYVTLYNMVAFCRWIAQAVPLTSFYLRNTLWLPSNHLLKHVPKSKLFVVVNLALYLMSFFLGYILSSGNKNLCHPIPLPHKRLLDAFLTIIWNFVYSFYVGLMLWFLAVT